MLDRGLMGGVKTKNRASADASLLCDSRSLLATPQGFYDDLQRQVSEENFNNIQSLFHNINVSSQNISKCLYKFMNNNGFRKLFKEELNHYYKHLHKIQKKSNSAVSSSSQHHCFGVITIYSDIINNINELQTVNDILMQVAISHGFLKNAKKSFKIHTMLFQRFLHQEFGKYIDKRTYKALKTFLSLICNRIITIAEHEINKNLETMTNTMKKQKDSIQSRTDKLATLSEIYKNPSQNFKSECSLLKITDAAYPGTSNGGL